MFDPQDAKFWVMVSFLLFCGFLIYKGVPGMIGRALDKRADKIRDELDEARRLREEAQELLMDYQRKAREAEDEAKAIIEQATREAESLAAETRKSLSEQLERRTKSVEEKIARAEARAVADVKEAAIASAVQASERILKARVKGEQASSMTDAAINDLRGKLN